MKWSRKVIGANIHVKGNKWNFINLRTWRRKWKMDKYMELKLSDKKHFNWLYVFIKSRTCFKVNPQSVNLAKWLSVRFWTKWLQIWVQLQSHNIPTKECCVTATGSNHSFYHSCIWTTQRLVLISRHKP